MTSRVLWVPFMWIMIIGSRPVSSWFNAGINIESPEAYLDGSPFDRNVYLSLIIAGFLVLLFRRVKWGRFISSNHWVLLFFIYCGISTIWSDYSFVSFKRWIKDAGNIIMILIILTETESARAIRAVFVRYAYVFIPFSVLAILYYPAIGIYNHTFWDTSQDILASESLYCGIANDKNALGCSVFISGLFLIWDFMETRAERYKRADLFGRAVLMLMAAWLILSAHSATALMCLLLGTGILLFLRLPIARQQVRYLGTYSLVFCLLILVIYAFPGILKIFVGELGRDMTFTGRTDVWADVLKVPINPVIGTGYQSFWMGSRLNYLWTLYPWRPNQAHNGYLEMYLNCGLVGFCLLVAMIVSTGMKLKKALMDGSREGMLFFAFFITILFYNWTEAMFYGINLLWIILLIAAISYTRKPPEFRETYLRRKYT